MSDDYIIWEEDDSGWTERGKDWWNRLKARLDENSRKSEVLHRGQWALPESDTHWLDAARAERKGGG